MPFKSSIHRAAVLVKCLPQKQSARIVLQLEAKELQRVFHAMRGLEDIPKPDRVAAMQRFLEKTNQVAATQDSAKFHNVPNRSDGPFEFLVLTSDSLRYRLVRNEHPDNLAVVLSFLPTQVASNVLTQFAANDRVAILRRLCRINKFDVHRVAKLSSRLHEQWQRMVNAEKFNRTGVDVASKLISTTDSETRNLLIESLSPDENGLAELLEDNVITFDHLLHFQDQDIKTILKWVDTSWWAPALKDAKPALRRKILSNLSERPMAILAQEIDSLPSNVRAQREHARLQIVTCVLQLNERNVIQIPNRTMTDNINPSKPPSRAA